MRIGLYYIRIEEVIGVAGYTRIYCIGGEGGFMGSDGINPIAAQIWEGDGTRQWLEAHYYDGSIGRLGRVKTVIPQGPGHPNALLDATLAFLPDLYRACPSLAEVWRGIADTEVLDFDQGVDAIPAAWAQLREEARSTFNDLIIYVADLVPLSRPQGV